MALNADPLAGLGGGDPRPVPLRADLTGWFRPAVSFVVQEAETQAAEMFARIEEGGEAGAALGVNTGALGEAVKAYPRGLRRILRGAFIAQALCVKVTGDLVKDQPENWQPDLKFWFAVLSDNGALEAVWLALSSDLAPVIDAGNA